MDDDLRADFEQLGVKLRDAVAALDSDEVRVSGSDVAALSRSRRLMGDKATSQRMVELQGDYDLLGAALPFCVGAGAAAIANERRMIRQLLDILREPEGTSKVAELASYRRARAAAAGAPTRRRQSR